MEYDNKRFKRAMIGLILMILLITELPYSDRSIIQYIILFISSRFTDGASIYVTSLWALPSVLVLFWITFEIIRSKRFNVNGFVIFMIMFFIVFPFIDKTTSLAKSTIYILNDGIDSIELVDSTLHITDFDNEMEAFIILELRNYEDLHESIGLELILPKVTNEFFEESIIKIDIDGVSYSDNVAIIRENVKLTLKDNINLGTVSMRKFKIYDYEVLIQHGTENRKYIRNDHY